MITRRDAIIISVILLLSLAGIFIPRLLSGGGSAVITIDGTAVRTVPLDKDCTFEENGISFEVKNGKIAVTSSPCEDGICERTGFISSTAQTIVCVPEKMTVTVTGKSDNDNIDLSVG